MNKPKILFVEDSKDLQEVVCSTLENEYEMYTALDAETGLVMFQRTHFDLLIVDLGLPKMNGYKFCTTIRSQEKITNVPIIIFSGSIDVEDKLMGFSIGANDYFSKPGDLRELRARIQIQLKKIDHKPAPKEIEVGPFQLNLIAQSICYTNDGVKKMLDLSSLEFRLLHFFLTHIDHVVSREQLLDQVWGSSRHVNDRAVDAIISKLRHKLDAHSGLIQSVHGSGYKFLNPEDYKHQKLNFKKVS